MKTQLLSFLFTFYAKDYQECQIWLLAFARWPAGNCKSAVSLQQAKSNKTLRNPTSSCGHLDNPPITGTASNSWDGVTAAVPQTIPGTDDVWGLETSQTPLQRSQPSLKRQPLSRPRQGAKLIIWLLHPTRIQDFPQPNHSQHWSYGASSLLTE